MSKRVIESLAEKVSGAGAGGLVSIALTREEYCALSSVVVDFVRGSSDDKIAIYDATSIAFAQGRKKGLEEAALSLCPHCNTRSWRGLDGRLYHFSEEETKTVPCSAMEIRELIDGGGAE